MSRRRGTSRAAEVTFAACLATVGISRLTLWLLSRPASWLSRFVDSRETVGGAR